MIPLHTKPGTEIVCVNAQTQSITRIPGFCYGPLTRLTAKAVYTVRDWVADHDGSPLVRLMEVKRGPRSVDGLEQGFHPSRFRLLEVHPSLTALLDAKPVDVKRLLETEGL